jgi:hypothetical protein
MTPRVYTEQFNGSGTQQLVLPNYPLLELQSLHISGQPMKFAPQANQIDTGANPYGYRFQPWNGIPPGVAAVIGLTGGAFYIWSTQGVVVKYKAGYGVVDEPYMVPLLTPFEIVPLSTFGIWATDEGVVYATGRGLLVAMPADTATLQVGQYIPPDPNATPARNKYTFSASDAGQNVLISYGYIPSDLEQACLETIQDRVSYRRRAGGVRSQSLAAQESITYSMSDGLSDFVKGILGPYCSPLPPAMGAFI